MFMGLEERNVLRHLFALLSLLVIFVTHIHADVSAPDLVGCELRRKRLQRRGLVLGSGLCRLGRLPGVAGA